MKNSKRRIPSIVRMADEAIKRAVKKALEDHYRKGFPIFIWQDQKVVRIPAHRIRPR